MAITTRDQLINALANNSSLIVIDKVSIGSTAAGQVFSLWTSAGTPGNGNLPVAAAVQTKDNVVGGIGFTNQTLPVTSYIGWLTLVTGNATTSIEIHDRLAAQGGLSGTSIAAQGAVSLVTTNPGADRIGNANYSDVQWWLEVYVDLGATSVNATVNVTYNDDSTGNLTAFSLGTTPRRGRMYPLISASAGKFIKAVNSVTLSATTGAVGNFGITATRPRTSLATLVANKTETFDWAALGLANVPNDSCLMMLVNCSTTSTGTVRGQGKICHG